VKELSQVSRAVVRPERLNLAVIGPVKPKAAAQISTLVKSF